MQIKSLLPEVSAQVLWPGMKNDYRALIGLECVTIVDISTDINDGN